MKETFCKLLALVLIVLLLLPAMAFAMSMRDESVQTTADIWDGSVADGFAGGTGTEDDPYLITNGAELAYLCYTVNVERNRYDGEFIKLANNIYLNDTTNWQEWGSTDADNNIIAPANEWTAIGIEDYSDYPNTWPSMIRATFDGAGHFVSGIYINNELNNQGLFGYNPCCTFKNLGVIDSYIAGRNEVGAIAGNIIAAPNPAYIYNCYNYGTVRGWNDVGGIAGAHNSIVDSCFNMGDVRLTGVTSGDPDMGGIVSYLWGTAENCYNIGTIQAENRWDGGIVGFNDGTVVNCYYLDTCGGLNEEGTSLTGEQMQNAASFVGFDFNAVWTMDGDADYLYPELINTPLWEEPAADIMMGDVNFSGEVLVDDALLVLRYSMSLTEFDDDQLEVADINGDGIVNSMDALLILRMVIA